MKKTLLIFLAIVTCGLSAFATVKGDVNGDGFVTSADVTAIYDILLGINNTFESTGDVNGDGYITSADVTAIYDILLGNIQPEEHPYVDLGLPSGTLWATMNVGANSPEEYGDYFAWGETTPKDWYDWSTYQWCEGNYNTLTKYCTNSSYGYNGFTDGKIELDLEDDAAYVNWSPDWRMPSQEQIQELYNNCFSEWTTLNGVNGRLFTGPNGASMFMPAAGSFGNYWSRTLLSSDPYYAYILYFYSGSVFRDYSDRYVGQSVRAVRVSP